MKKKVRETESEDKKKIKRKKHSQNKLYPCNKKSKTKFNAFALDNILYLTWK